MDGVDGVAGPAEDTESVLAAFRERKRRALEASRASPPVSGVLVSPSTMATPASSDEVLPPPGPAPSPWPNPPLARPPPAATHPPAPPAPPVDLRIVPAIRIPGPPPDALASIGPSSTGLAPGVNLSPVGPALRLSETLLRDRQVSLSGSPALRNAGVAAALLGLALLVLDRRQAALATPIPGLLVAAAVFLLAGVAMTVAGGLWPRTRSLAVRLAANQREEWRRVQRETARLVVLGRIGLALAAVGLVGLAAAYLWLSLPLLVAGAACAATGLGLMLVVQVRRSLARRLYVQTLVLSGLEASGLGGGAADGRVPPVILALDQLLGSLPEADVQAFLRSPQARAYLDLVDEATRSQRGP